MGIIIFWIVPLLMVMALLIISMIVITLVMPLVLIEFSILPLVYPWLYPFLQHLSHLYWLVCSKFWQVLPGNKLVKVRVPLGSLELKLLAPLEWLLKTQSSSITTPEEVIHCLEGWVPPQIHTTIIHTTCMFSFIGMHIHIINFSSKYGNLF